MLMCKMRGPIKEIGWEHSLLDLETLGALPIGPVSVDRARFPEHRLEFSFLRDPSLLMAGLGLTKSDHMVLLRQVSEVDLYLSVGDSLHLIEVKGITGPRPFRKSLSAARQITDYWLQKAAWIRSDTASVKLWTICPVDWKSGSPTLPDNWAKELSEIKATSLQGQFLADIGLVFYTVFLWPTDGHHHGTEGSTGIRSLPEHLFVLWRADEPTPIIATKD